MPSDLGSYLATHYLTADPKPSKKRKRKLAAPDNGLLITDDNDTGWTDKPRRAAGDGDEDDGAAGPATVAGTTADFRRAKKSSWKTVGGGPAKDPIAPEDESAAADAILASAAAENAAARAADEDRPAVAIDADGPSSVVTMSDGTHAGLQSAAAVTAQLRRRAERERREYEAQVAARGGSGEEPEAVFRDATGRRIDVGMRRAEARRAAAEAEERERRAREALRGDVQAEEARQRRERLEDAAVMGVARRRDDEEMNRELREAERWNDPMAQFLTRKGGGDGGSGGGGRKKKKGKARPVYGAAAPPNRYGIRPGYRWDGVDRGNGFEAERFKALNRRERNKGLDYAWQMDV